MMSRLLFSLAFALGASAIAWTAASFFGADSLALAVTLLIAAAYGIGVAELLHFRRATTSLSIALSELREQAVAELQPWLAALHDSLQNPVRLRIEGERVALPAPIVTPYLVGLLVMLGLVGTFLGMVDTLQGAVAALEGSTELEAIRAGLAAPIQGLGLAFGTSVAGVAASAMLGLMSTLSRRDRVQATRQLDIAIGGEFREFSLVHNRQRTYAALQQQSDALPAVADQMQQLASHIQTLAQQLNDTLIANQQQFQQQTGDSYRQLADSVGSSLQQTLADSAAESRRQTAECNQLTADSARDTAAAVQQTLKTAFDNLLTDIRRDNGDARQLLAEQFSQQLSALSTQFSNTSGEVSDSWQRGIAEQQQLSLALTDKLETQLLGLGEQLQQRGTGLVDRLTGSAGDWVEQQRSADQQRLELWAQRFSDMQGQGSEQLSASTTLFSEQLAVFAQQQLALQQQRDQQSSESAERLSGELDGLQQRQQNSVEQTNAQIAQLGEDLSARWQQASQQSAQHQNVLNTRLAEAVTAIEDRGRDSIEKLLAEGGRLLRSSEQMIDARRDSEQRWLVDQGQRSHQLCEHLQLSIAQLCEQEQLRSDASIARLEAMSATAGQQLAALEQAAGSQLAALGERLEQPMTALIATASETPKAAAEVISQLRGEISNNVERDNQLLEERRISLEQLQQLSMALTESSAGQRDAIASLVEQSNQMLTQLGSELGDKLGERVDSEMSTLVESAEQFSEHMAGSAVEMSCLTEAFGGAVKSFGDSNQQLCEQLARIEQTLEQSSTRSDEQLGYYVAQAREIIDHSMLSQREIFEQLRTLGKPEAQR